MPADVKAEELFFVRKLFMLAPWSNQPFPRCCGGSCLVEERNLTGNAVPMRSRGCTQRFINTGKKFGALAAKKIKGARFYQTFQHFAIGDAGIQPAAKILQRSEIPSPFALANCGFHCAFADVFDRGKTVTNGPESGIGDPGYILRSKFQAAFVDVGREDGNAHAFALADEDGNLIGVVDLIAQQSSHELDRVMRF